MGVPGKQHHPLGEEERDEMAEMHRLRGGPPPSVEEERLLLLVGIQDAMHVTRGSREDMAVTHSSSLHEDP